MAASTNQLSLILAQQDSNGTNILNRTIGAIQYAGSVGAFKADTLLDTNAHAQTLPAGITTVLQYYIKNTHASAFITVTATPTGVSSQVVIKLGPGAVHAMWSPVATSPAGYSAISLTSDVANATFEQFIGG